MTEIEFAQVVAASFAANALALVCVLGIVRIHQHEKRTGSVRGVGFWPYFAVIFPLVIAIIGVWLVRS